MKNLDSLSRACVPHVEEYYDLLQYDPDPVDGYRLRPQKLPHITINADGYRGKPFTGQEEILLLGDSVTFGVGASSDEARFARFLETCAGRPVADASVRAYRVFQHFGRLPVLLERLPRTRRILLWCGYADLLFWVLSNGSVDGAFGFSQRYAEKKPRGAAGAWKRLTERFHPKPPAVASGERKPLESLTAQMMTHIRALRDLSASRGIELAILVQPFVRSRPERPQIRQICDGYEEKTREKFGTGWYGLSEEFIRLLRRGLEEEMPGRWVDCQPLVSEEDFLDQVHLKEEAAARLAGRLAERLFKRSLSAV